MEPSSQETYNENKAGGREILKAAGAPQGVFDKEQQLLIHLRTLG